MKHLTLLLAMLLSTSAFATAGGTEIVGGYPRFPETGPLDGMKFCRTVISEGWFGQPKGKRSHCLTFEEGMVTDNGNTFFGNPPETLEYRIERRNVFIGDSVYELVHGEGSLVYIPKEGEREQIFERVKE